ncbi:hypothetical protein E0L93_03005 [Rubrobacter taiwanensis]|jgi:hypothetical protein|uniref:Uncharacterized protein n=1 Tax=Rubrobacter taiwanensis TaxID=185139 RepID=A0A4R1BRT7_9ACTN|nr:hypothetical protein [Rubrobacter taiwanensis]TCJ19935.1 hypothetical protein E0L93_03005 [Rubrobacter taiwanensis]
MPEDRTSRRDVGSGAGLARDYICRMEGFRCGGGVCRIRIYRGERLGDAPVVICSELAGEEVANISLLAEYIAGEVICEHFPGGLPDLPRPLIWIEQHFTFEGDPREYSLVSFPFYRPRPDGLGFDRRMVLGTPRRETITAAEVAALVGEEEERR